MEITDTEDIKLPTIDSLNINSDDFDTSEFWKSCDETNQNIFNEKLIQNIFLVIISSKFSI